MIDAASALLSTLDMAVVPSATENGNDAPPNSHATGANIPVHLLSDGQRSAFEFFLGFYAFTFVNATATFGLTPQTANMIHRIPFMFPPHGNKLKFLRGCEDWTMLIILDIVILRDWKEKALQAGRLSIRELNSRAALIEEKLQEGITRSSLSKTSATAADDNNRRRSTTPSTPPTPSLPSEIFEEEVRMMTSSFIHGALVFLNVVVSGFYPNITEIKSSVLETLTALEYMRARSVVNIPSWPYFVAGCLAQETEYPRFRALVTPFVPGKVPLVMTMWSLEVLEECWKVRASQPEEQETCSWVTAMKNRGTRYLLL
ncbi:hypothetical protein LTR84_000207 [Exophiala bonariae]|uniref:Uncharacterized protein n=1 Tax=Exophiala bonariae TaxID=1690606 RepID=A0AAV9NPX7_9EURO|nr:hypothetical protein LTR84_000207 [Exophiala bonariae]